QAREHAAEVAHAIAIRIEKRARINLIDGSALPPVFHLTYNDAPVQSFQELPDHAFEKASLACHRGRSGISNGLSRTVEVAGHAAREASTGGFPRPAEDRGEPHDAPSGEGIVHASLAHPRGRIHFRFGRRGGSTDRRGGAGADGGGLRRGPPGRRRPSRAVLTARSTPPLCAGQHTRPRPRGPTPPPGPLR